ncbi:vacuolar membrane protein-domain-containing protein [Lasiosphaeria ovina]|uniref:Vacuolar membrane protein-domain-containing protein n=1 Tax=Lasiosphaeria ovina TaxID=92902 RepID=A0AAE0TXJ9_9PEZI|nr:vacuolar membrane protein-domain-containing protein [Lasiosphaeria ovina]
MEAPSPTSLPAGPVSPAENSTECRLLGSFAILVQLALGGLALLALVYKRWKERPQRPVKIWFFDVSKQVFGSVLVHMANVFMSLLTSGRFSIRVSPATVGQATRRAVMVLALRGGEYVPNPCSFYLLNLAIDTTLGIPILIIIVRVTTRLVSFTPLGKPAESIQSGNYGNPPNAWWWLKQSVIYFCGLMGMKFCVLVLFMTLPWISHIGDWALGWTEGNERLQIVFVMMLFPLIMNAMQYYIIDSYIKKQESLDDVDELDEGDVTEPVIYDEISVSGSDGSDDSEDEVAKGRRVRMERRDTPKDLEYDPSIDGESQTVIGSSSSRTSDRRALLPKELIPPE